MKIINQAKMLHTGPLICEVNYESTSDSMMSVTHKPSRVALCFSFAITVCLELPPSVPLPINLHSNPASWKVCLICITNHAELEADCECWADMWCPVCSGNVGSLSLQPPSPDRLLYPQEQENKVLHPIARSSTFRVSCTNECILLWNTILCLH